MARRKARKKRERQPFWKKIKNPELKHIAEHIGKITDNTSWKDILDVILAGASGYAGFAAAQTLGANTQDSLKSALLGMIAYRLATSPNLIAGASGTIVLGSLGLIDVWNPLTGWLQANLHWSNISEKAQRELKAITKPEEWLSPEHWSGGIRWNPKYGPVIAP